METRSRGAVAIDSDLSAAVGSGYLRMCCSSKIDGGEAAELVALRKSAAPPKEERVRA